VIDQASFLISRFNNLDEAKNAYSSDWNEIKWLFKLASKKDNVRKSRDSTAALALERFGAALQMILTPKDQEWHSLKAETEQLNENQAINGFLQKATQLLHELRNSSNFIMAINQVYLSLGAYGTGVLFVDEKPDRSGIDYRCIPLEECWIAQNSTSQVDTVFRKYTLTARQAIQEFGADNLPENIVKDSEDEKRFEAPHDFLHCVFPRSDYSPWKPKTARNMPIASYHVAYDKKVIVRESGYRTMPYIVSRYIKLPDNDPYGISPAMQVLSDALMLNEMQYTIARAAQKAVDPPLLLSDNDVLSGFDLRAGALNYAAVSPEGKQLVYPLQTGANLPLGFEMIEQKRKAINDAFLITLFQVLTDTPNMTATEATLRKQEQGDMLAPAMSRQQSELLEPLIARELDILEANGVFNEIPEGLTRAVIQYESPLAKVQRGQDGLAIIKVFEMTEKLFQMFPEMIKMFKPEEVIRKIVNSFSAPVEIILSPEEMAAMQQMMAAQQAQAQQMAAMQQIAGIAKDGGAGINSLMQADATTAGVQGMVQ
jgi:hypothetical protein